MSSHAPSAGPGTVRLHFHPRTRATRARWMLEELGLDHELVHVDLRAGAQRRAAHRALHPLGKVPVLEIDGTVIFETLAIGLYLADRAGPGVLAPPPVPGAARAAYLQWMAFSVATLEPVILEEVRCTEDRTSGARPRRPSPAFTPFPEVAALLDRTLAARPFLLGPQISAADVMTGSGMIWAETLGLLGAHPHLARWLETLKARPAHARATRDPRHQTETGGGRDQTA